MAQGWVSEFWVLLRAQVLQLTRYLSQSWVPGVAHAASGTGSSPTMSGFLIVEGTGAGIVFYFQKAALWDTADRRVPKTGTALQDPDLHRIS